MTQRENLLAALSCRPVEWVPVTPVIDNFNFIWPLPGSGLAADDYVGMTKYFGHAVIDRGGAPAPFVVENLAARSERTEHGDEITERIVTDGGVLTQTSMMSREANTTFHAQRLIRSEGDYAIFRAYLEGQRFVYSEGNVLAARARLADVGDEGIIYQQAPCSPIMQLARNEVGVTNFLYDYYDYPEQVFPTLELMLEIAAQQYEMIGRHSPAECVVLWEDVDTGILSMKMVREWVVPAIRRYARILHRYGKKLILHTCGHIKDILPLFPEMEPDAVDWVAHAPVGNVTFDEVRSAWGSGIAIMGAMDPSAFRFGSAEELQGLLKQYFQEIAPGDGFVLMLPPPKDTPLERMRALLEAVDRWARYPIKF